jgi:hypothetical protein
MSDVSNKIYQIGNQRFHQNKLVIGQLMQLVKALSGLNIPGTLNIQSVLNAIGDKISDILAIILIPDGKSIKEKDRGAIAEFLDDNLDMDLALEIIEDFFLSNQIHSLLEKITKLSQTMTGQTKDKLKE